MSELESKIIISLVSLVIGGMLTALATYIRNRLRTLEYRVFHDRVAFAADDTTFGNVRVTWNDKEVRNLFVCTAVLDNSTSKDYSDLKVKVYTGNDSLLLTQYVELVGTTCIPQFTDEFKKAVHLDDGQQPTEQQINIYHHSREFLIPILNRGQKLLVRFLVTAPNAPQGPAIWMESLHPGLKLKYAPNHNQILGVSVKITVPMAISISLLTFLICMFFVSEVWIAASLCTFVGLFAQHIGAIIYRTIKPIYKALLG
jgi:hypothetical protein